MIATSAAATLVLHVNTAERRRRELDNNGMRIIFDCVSVCLCALWVGDERAGRGQCGQTGGWKMRG